jgi:ataxia telangiectasia mutated family protein
MQHFFMENFATPSAWFERQQAYARSLAACCFVGYLVGLGDRHLSNILIDARTAELLHIDLGLSFDQGTLLPVPERVPFRLTRDLVAALGVAGTEGTFRIFGTRVLSCLRGRRELLQTLLEVFLHDPLAKWSVDLSSIAATSGPAAAAGGSDLASLRRATGGRAGRIRTADADRALQRVRDKLAGFDGHEFLAVEAQVRKLIDDARNTDTLAAMYPGWSQWV